LRFVPRMFFYIFFFTVDWVSKYNFWLDGNMSYNYAKMGVIIFFYKKTIAWILHMDVIIRRRKNKRTKMGNNTGYINRSLPVFHLLVICFLVVFAYQPPWSLATLIPCKDHLARYNLKIICDLFFQIAHHQGIKIL
jgi:hypothetical protein